MADSTKGIYTITNLLDGKYYVGSSLNVKRRLLHHKNKLIKNKHDNSYLQNAWNKYGEAHFKFEIVLNLNHCDEKTIRAVEQEILNKEFDKTYNLSRYAIMYASNIKRSTKITNESKRKSGGDVLFNKKSNKWRVCISVQNNTIHLGCFDTQEEALKCRLEAEKKYWAKDFVYHKRPKCIPLNYRRKTNTYEVILEHKGKTYNSNFKTEIEAYEYVKELRKELGIVYP